MHVFGVDGFPPKFFLCYWDHIGINVIEALQYMFTLGDMPYQWNAGLIFFIPKLEGVVVDIKKWCSITILNTIYKIYAKILSLHMQPLSNYIIHKSQTSFIQEHTIFYNIFMFWELTTLAKEKDVDLVVQLLNYGKAYDRVDWSFLEEVMLRLGFPMAQVVAIRDLCI